MKGTKDIIRLAVAAAMIAASAAGCRRPLFVAGDEFRSAVLHTDWRNYQKYDPDGMTAWFFPLDEEEDGTYSYHYTSSNVRTMDFYIPSGRYAGLVIDYSPAEYSKQEFLGMDFASSARVKVTPTAYQPDSIAALYGKGCFHEDFPKVVDRTGLFEVANQPESMAMDTLKTMVVKSGEYGYYIPYEVSDTYQETLTVQDFYAYPVTPVWKMRVRMYVKGIDYIWGIEGSVAGLADGRWLVKNRASEDPCLVSLSDWEIQRTGDNEGYVAVTLNTFGVRGNLRPVTSLVNPYHESEPMTQMKPSAVIADWTGTEQMTDKDVRLNVKFLLRDRSTALYYHYDVGDRIVSYDEELVLRLDLEKDSYDYPDIPFVEPYNGTGFDADVRPWEDGGEADIPL